jgi:hypothetical protein
VRKCHSHKNQPARQQQIDQIQWLTAKTPRAPREEEINKFTHRFLGVLRVFAVKIGVEPPTRREEQWVYRGSGNYFCFEDGILASIQTSQ